MDFHRLEKNDFQKKTNFLSLDLLGKYIVRKNSLSDPRIGKIVETEMYYGAGDKACHASWKKREKCEALYGPPGHLYVYLTYGIYWMLNIVTEEEGFPAAVLVRAVEPLFLSNKIERQKLTSSKIKELRQLGSGPGRLTRWMEVDKSFNREDLTISERIWVENRGEVIKPEEIVKTTRIGVDYAGEWKNKPWRFYIKNSPYVSKK